MFGKKRKELSEEEKKKDDKNFETLSKIIDIGMIHLGEKISEVDKTDLNLIDEIRISHRVSQDNKEKKKNGVERDLLDKVKDSSEIRSKYKYEKEYKKEWEKDSEYSEAVEYIGIIFVIAAIVYFLIKLFI